MLIVFDLDGTIFKTELTTIPAVIRALHEIDAAIPAEDEIKRLIGKPMDEFCFNLIGETDEHRFQLFRNTLRAHEQELIRTNPQPYPEIIEVLRYLSNDHNELAICSNGSLEYIDLVLNACQIADYFSLIRGREAQRSKAEHLADILNTIHPDECVVIGDTLEDFDAARRNHIPSVGVRYGYGLEDIKAASYQVQEAHEIPGTIERIKLCSLIYKDLKQFQLPVVVGINGVDTSGKTEFANFLATYLEAKGRRIQVIHLDDFHNPLSLRRQGRNEQEAYIENAFNLQIIKEAILDPLKDKKALDIELELLDLDTDLYSNKKRFTIDQKTIVILEETLLYREPVIDGIDYKIYMDISFDEVVRRAEKRDVPKYGTAIIEKYQEKYIPIQKWYIEKYAPHRICNMVIDNENFERPKVKYIMG